MIVGYGVSDGRGRFVYDSAADDAVLRWPAEGDAAIRPAASTRPDRQIAGTGSLLMDTTNDRPYHVASPRRGGDGLGVRSRRAGCSGSRGLYVLDGALMPGNTAACNPSMTIAAVAERALEAIVGRDVDHVF